MHIKNNNQFHMNIHFSDIEAMHPKHSTHINFAIIQSNPNSDAINIIMFHPDNCMKEL